MTVEQNVASVTNDVHMFCDWGNNNTDDKTVTWHRNREDFPVEIIFEFISEEGIIHQEERPYFTGRVGYNVNVTGHELILLDVTKEDTGVYWCVLDIHGYLYESKQDNLTVKGQ